MLEFEEMISSLSLIPILEEHFVINLMNICFC